MPESLKNTGDPTPAPLTESPGLATIRIDNERLSVAFDPEDARTVLVSREALVSFVEGENAWRTRAEAAEAERDALQVEVNRAGSQVTRLANERTKADQHRKAMGRAYDEAQAALAAERARGDRLAEDRNKLRALVGEMARVLAADPEGGSPDG